MSRPLYESAQDREKEHACIEVFATKYGMSYAKLPYYKHIDYLLFDPKTKRGRGWLEVKVRNHAHGDYPTLLLSSLKWTEGLRLSEATGVPFWILIKWTNGLYGYTAKLGDVQGGKVWLEYGGRTVKTRDEGDVEPVVHIPIDLFTQITP